MSQLPNFEINVHEFEAIDNELLLETKKLEDELGITSRFLNFTNDDLLQLVRDTEAKGTQRNTKWGIKLFQGNRAF